MTVSIDDVGLAFRAKLDVENNFVSKSAGITLLKIKLSLNPWNNKSCKVFKKSLSSIPVILGIK